MQRFMQRKLLYILLLINNIRRNNAKVYAKFTQKYMIHFLHNLCVKFDYNTVYQFDSPYFLLRTEIYGAITNCLLPIAYCLIS
jgi:hypothetical protein